MIVISDNDINELVDFIHSNMNLDLTNYAKSSLTRRFVRLAEMNSLKNLEDFKLHISKLSKEELIQDITVNTTEMFRDPSFWKLLREQILPEYAVHNTIRIWHAGCSTGEEVISMQILLEECGIRHKTITYATDIDKSVLEVSKKGTYFIKNLSLSEQNYKDAGGNRSFDDYIEKKWDNLFSFHSELINKVQFKQLDLVKEKMFTKFDIILCRNVLIYFDFDLQEKVITNFIDCLFEKGMIAIGLKETIINNTLLQKLNVYDGAEKVYQLK